jgi:lipoprotein-releasing system permease protein
MKFRGARFILNIALRHLASKRRQTTLVIAGVAVGSMVMILTFGLAEGIITDIRNKIIDISPLITIKGEKVKGKPQLLLTSTPHSASHFEIVSRIVPDEKKEVKPYTEIVSLADAVPGIDAVSPFVSAQGVLRYLMLSRPCFMKGVIPQREALIGKLNQNITTGSLNELSYTKNGILLGTGLARKIGASCHDMVKFIGEDGQVHSLLVVGTFTSGFGAVDDNNAYVNLRLAQTIDGFAENTVSAIGIHTTSLNDVKRVSAEVSSLTGYQTETWEEANANLLSLFERNNNITLFLVIFVFVVAGFGIANVLITIVLQKQKDIAVMKSMGVSIRSLELVFLAEGMLLGITGAAIGLVAGHYLTALVSALPFSYGPSAVVRGDHIVTVQKPIFFFVTGFFALVVSAISAWGPARRAARLKPVDILRA